ncbi:MAG: hypothetical protein LBO04_08635 [Spirochaetaceae bacterium]|nr:hypothetical protein [Spirochaetaceae bacterium]
MSKRVKKYGREDILTKRIKAGTMNGTDELQAARKRIREPGAALAGALKTTSSRHSLMSV